MKLQERLIQEHFLKPCETKEDDTFFFCRLMINENTLLVVRKIQDKNTKELTLVNIIYSHDKNKKHIQ